MFTVHKRVINCAWRSSLSPFDVTTDSMLSTFHSQRFDVREHFDIIQTYVLYQMISTLSEWMEQLKYYCRRGNTRLWELGRLWGLTNERESGGKLAKIVQHIKECFVLNCIALIRFIYSSWLTIPCIQKSIQ